MKREEAEQIIAEFCEFEIENLINILGVDHPYESAGEELTVGDVRKAYYKLRNDDFKLKFDKDKRYRCPKCGDHTLKFVDQSTCIFDDWDGCRKRFGKMDYIEWALKNFASMDSINKIFEMLFKEVENR